MGQLAQAIHDTATARIPAAPVTRPADLLTGPQLLAIFAQVEAAVACLELRAAGSEIHANTGPPSNNVGNDLDLYLNTANGDLWGKDAGEWSFLLNLRGPQGIQGVKGGIGNQGDRGPKGDNGKNGSNGRDGSNGDNGTNGNRISAPAAAPASSDGQEGDLAIVASTGDLQEKTASGWVTRGNLKGPKGDGGTGGNSSGGSTNGVTLISSGDGTKYLANDGTYKTVQVGNNTTGPTADELKEAAQDATAAMLAAGNSTTIQATYDDAANKLELEVKNGSILLKHFGNGLLSEGEFSVANKTRLENAANWTGSGDYVGTGSQAITGSSKLDIHTAGNYVYLNIAADFPIRLQRV